MKIGFVIPLFEVPAYGNRALRYTELREMALQTEKAGFDSIWLYDHLLFRLDAKGKTIGLLSSDKPERTKGIWECWTMLSALAEATRHVELGTLVLCNPFRNPAILAKMAHTIDEVSNGRFILGIGAGWNQPEFDAYGVHFTNKVNRFEEAMQIIRPLLKEGHVDFEGAYYQARDCEITPRGPRPNGPPLMVGSFGPRMLRLTAQYADMWNTAYLHQPDSLTEPLSNLHAACAEVSRDPTTIEITATVALAYSDLSDPPHFMQEEGYLTGAAEEVATAMRSYEERGVSHLIFHISPYSTEGFARLVEAMEIYRKNDT